MRCLPGEGTSALLVNCFPGSALGVTLLQRAGELPGSIRWVDSRRVHLCESRGINRPLPAQLPVHTSALCLGRPRAGPAVGCAAVRTASQALGLRLSLFPSPSGAAAFMEGRGEAEPRGASHARPCATRALPTLTHAPLGDPAGDNDHGGPHPHHSHHTRGSVTEGTRVPPALLPLRSF